jgi:DNA-binding transcriptional MerR regulator
MTESHATNLEIGIDELARRCGTTVRTVREYQTLGVLPPPRKQGRVAVYGDRHVARLQAVARLQERGYSLAAIADLLSAWETGSTLPAVLGLGDAPTVGAIDEVPVIVAADDLAAGLPAIFGTKRLARRAERVGLVHVLDGGRYHVRSPALVQLVAELLEAGVSASQVLDVVEGITAHADALAGPAAALVQHHLMGATADGVPSDDDVQRLRRVRLLLAQAAATTLVDRIGGVLTDEAADRPELAALLDRVRVGQVRDTTARSRS